MSKKVKSLIERDLKKKIGDVDGVAVLNPRGIDGKKNNELRRKLHGQGLKLTIVKNTLAKRAIGGGKLKGFDTLLDGPSALVYGKGSVSAVARLLLDAKKANEKLELRGIFFDGELYLGDKGIEQASKLPTREEAVGLVLAAILSPGRKLGGILKGQASKVASLIKAVEEKAKEREAAAPAAAAPAAEAAAPAAEAPAAPTATA
jgi:large subunit ribosomal protein L10